MHIAFAQFYSSKPTPDYRKIASVLRVRGHTVWVGTPDEAGDLAWYDGERVVAVQRGPTRLPDRWLRVRLVASVLRRVVFFSFMLRVRSFLRQSRPEIVQVNPASVFWVWVLPLFMPSQMRFILDFRQVDQRGATDLMGRLRGSLANWNRQICSRFVYHRACFLHPAGARITLGKSWSKWGSVVPMGVAPHFLTLERTDSASRRDENPVRFLYVGTLARVRQLELILFAVQRMLEVTDEFQVVFIGPDAAQGFYHNLVNELKLDSIVTIKPPVRYEDIPEVALGYDVTLAYVPDRPADWHYHPTLKVLEYRALGMPIIATDNEPNREVVEDGANGLLVQNSIESLAEGMLRFVTDRDFLERCRTHARMMRQGTTWSEVAEMYERDVYQELRNTKLLISERQ